MILISQLINDNSRVLQKLLKYFSDRTISTSYVLPSADVFPVIVILDCMIENLLNYYLAHLCNITITFQLFLNNCHYILSNYTSALLYQYF